MSQWDLSYFSIHTEKLIQVLYERTNCSCSESVSMLCSRVVANYRYPETLELPLFIENDVDVEENENENISDDEFDIYSDKRKLMTTIENELNTPQLYDTGIQHINVVLKDIGYICNDDKMYTMQPSQMFYYKHNIISYNEKRCYFLPKSDNVMDSPNTFDTSETSNNQSLELKLQNNVDENRNSYYHEQSVKPTNFGCNRREKRHKRQKLQTDKYWSKRYMLFSKYDDGIWLDKESLYSVCPEILSYHIAKRCTCDIALDPFCGAGGNIIQLALTCKLVIAIDIDPEKIKFAKHNAEIYGVADKIEFIVGDFFTMSSMLKADVVFMSPPWGGPNYLLNDSFSILSMCEHQHSAGGFGIFNIVKNIAPNIAFHMPRTTNIFECLWISKDFGSVEVQQNIINGKLNSITAFYGNFTDITDNDY